MISVQKAKELIVENVQFLSEKIEIDVENALDFKLAEDLYSPLDLPCFNQSNVDGYAICGIENLHSWKVIGEIKAGDFLNENINSGECFRIFTGAAVPSGVEAIVMQEYVERFSDTIQIKQDFQIKNGQQIRLKASQIKKGDLALAEGHFLTPSSLSFIHMLGIKTIQVYKKPKIALIVTGNELQFAGEKLKYGKVFEANSSAIKSILQQNGIDEIEIFFAKDDKEFLKSHVKSCIEMADIILLSGGISVGDYDFVKVVNEELNTKTIFHKIAQKPGKPLFFGKNKSKLIFGLPGNPASALTCMYEYVVPCIKIALGKTNCFPIKNECENCSRLFKKIRFSKFFKRILRWKRSSNLRRTRFFYHEIFCRSKLFGIFTKRN
jgi:molybdopterin molybdotransferase